MNPHIFDGVYLEFLFSCLHSVFICCLLQSLAQQALMGTINSSMQAVQQAQTDLGHVDNLPPLGHDLVSPLSQFCIVLKSMIG